MDVYYCSDLHLEFNKHYRLPAPKSDYLTTLVLAGDIGNSSIIDEIGRFLDDAKSKFDCVMYVLGNHEYYHTELVQGYLDYSDICDEYNIILLEKNMYNNNGVKFIGSTYWSYIHPGKLFITDRLNDFRLIGGMNLDIFNMRHIDNKKYMEEMGVLSGPKIAVSHHAPLLKGTSHPRYTDQSGFATDEPDVVRLYDHWIFGHTHYRNRFQFEKTWLYTNALGYPGEIDEEFALEHFIV